VNDKVKSQTEKELESFRLEQGIALEEYSALRAEIISHLEAAFKTTEITLTAIGILIAGAAFVLQNNRKIVFAAASLFFYILALTQLRYLIQVKNLSDYISFNVASRIRENLTRLSSNDQHRFDSMMTWELKGRNYTHSNTLFLLPVEAARYGIPIMAGILSYATYLITTYQANQINPIFDLLLFFLNNAVLIYTVWAVIKTRRMLANQEQH